MRNRTLLGAAALLVAAALPAVAYERVEIRNKDSVLGAITEFQGTHEFFVDIPRDAAFSMSLPKQKDSRLQGSMGVFDLGYRSQRLLLVGKRKIALERPPAASARYRAIVRGVNDSTGLYVLKPKIKVQKKYKIRGQRSQLSPPGSIVFGALPDHDVSLKITWKGPDPVTIGSFLAPDGSDVTSPEPGKQRKSVFKQKGFRTTQFGDHVVELDIPSSATQWTLTVIQKAKTPKRTLNLRPDHGAPPDLDVSFAPGPYPAVTVHGESGAGNEVLLTAVASQPVIIGVTGEADGECGFAALEGGSTPRFYGLTCGESHSVLMTVGSRDESRRILEMTRLRRLQPAGRLDGGAEVRRDRERAHARVLRPLPRRQRVHVPGRAHAPRRHEPDVRLPALRLGQPPPQRTARTGRGSTTSIS
jgi:hypothetical protein